MSSGLFILACQPTALIDVMETILLQDYCRGSSFFRSAESRDERKCEFSMMKIIVKEKMRLRCYASARENLEVRSKTSGAFYKIG